MASSTSSCSSNSNLSFSESSLNSISNPQLPKGSPRVHRVIAPIVLSSVSNLQPKTYHTPPSSPNASPLSPNTPPAFAITPLPSSSTASNLEKVALSSPSLKKTE